MDLFFREMRRRIDPDEVLSKIESLLDWTAFLSRLKQGLPRSGQGRRGYAPLVLFQWLVVGQWHGLSAPKLERALKVGVDFMLFCGLDLHGDVPDETTPCRFRNSLLAGGICDKLLAEVCRQLEAHSSKLHGADTAIVDATLIVSAARLRAFIDAPQDRCEEKTSVLDEMHFSADADARWVKKGGKSTLGYKGFVRCDE